VVVHMISETLPFMPLQCYEHIVSTISYVSISFLEGYLQGLFLSQPIHF
jgi:hypothetical protein